MNGEIINKYLRRILLYPLLLLRVPNIIIVALTVWVFATKVVYPRFISADILPVMSMKDLYLLVFIIACIAAGGYLLNDIIDIKSDRVNNKRSYINTGIERLIAYVAYAIIALVPIPFAYSLASEINRIRYVPLYFLVVFLLIFYNLFLKKTPLLGNVLVSILCVGVIWVFFLAEQESLNKLQSVDPSSFSFIWSMSIFYYAFSFCSNLGREIIKDILDVNGDKTTGANTLPLVIGIQHSIRIVVVVLWSLGAFLVCWMYFFDFSWYTYFTVSLLVGVPLFVLIYYLLTDQVLRQLSMLSSAFKIWMLLGLIFIYINS